jgi:hypothetical protein
MEFEGCSNPIYGCLRTAFRSRFHGVTCPLRCISALCASASPTQMGRIYSPRISQARHAKSASYPHVVRIHSTCPLHACLIVKKRFAPRDSSGSSEPWRRLWHIDVCLSECTEDEYSPMGLAVSNDLVRLTKPSRKQPRKQNRSHEEGAIAKELLLDALWARIAPLLPPKSTGERPQVSDQAALAGILFGLKTGIPGILACRDGVWERDNVLAQAASLVPRGRLAQDAPGTSRRTGPGRSYRLGPGRAGLRCGTGPGRGPRNGQGP